MGTDFFQFGPFGAEMIGFKEGWGPKSLSVYENLSKLGRSLQSQFTLPLLVTFIKFQYAMES